MESAFYADVIAAGGLTAALERAAADLALDVTVLPADSDRTASIAAPAPGREPLDIHLEDGWRYFGVDGWSRGVAMIGGGTPDLGDVVRAGAAWGSGTSLPELRAQLSWVEYGEFAEAADRSPAAAVDVAWRLLREWAAEMPEFREFGAALEAAYRQPRLRQLLPFSSVSRLGFRPSVGHVYPPAVVIVPARDGGPYRVQRTLDRETDDDLLGEVPTATQAAALAAAHVPADLGPAVAGPDDL
ncbi:DUF6193 family natural product biosynthesis protein [Kitasatospora sp. NPDC059599]|uniref:DUF6193 family natural product biosynthesis protein n=1 Tax=Kitasatospora sp. NPDC059599 TaxID=3346880 RepID=UPI0036AD5C02